MGGGIDRGFCDDEAFRPVSYDDISAGAIERHQNPQSNPAKSSGIKIIALSAMQH